MKKFQEDGATSMCRPNNNTLLVVGPKRYLDEMQQTLAAFWVDIYKPIKKGKS